jgi:WD domain, G-beta repeat
MIPAALLVAVFAANAADPLPPGAVLRLGDTRFRAGGEVRDLRFSADGRTLHAWVAEPNAKYRPVAWDAATGVSLPLAISPALPDLPANATPAVRLGGNRVLTAGPGCAGVVWDADTRKELARLTGHVGRVTAVAASADGTRLATGSADGLVRLWDAETFRPISEPFGHTGPVRSVRISADGSRAVTTGDDGTARVWNLTTGRQLRAFAAVGPVELDPRGTAVVIPAGGTVVVRDVVTGLEVVTADRPATPEPDLSDWLARFGFTLSRDGRVLAAANRDGTIALYESASKEVRRTLAGHRGGRVLGFTPDGTRLFTSGTDHTILVWDVRLQALPLTAAIKKETSAPKLWTTMSTGRADAAYLAMARLAVEPPAAVKMARMRLKPSVESDAESAASKLADTRAVELLESLGTPAARELLKELADGEPSAWRTQEASLALERLK